MAFDKDYYCGHCSSKLIKDLDKWQYNYITFVCKKCYSNRVVILQDNIVYYSYNLVFNNQEYRIISGKEHKYTTLTRLKYNQNKKIYDSGQFTEIDPLNDFTELEHFVKKILKLQAFQ
jgi:hypothetical protein